MKLKNLASAKITGKRVLLRADLDVPLRNGKVADNTRIKAGLETIRYLLSHKASQIIIIGHAGRPHGKRILGLSLRPIAAQLSTLLKKPVGFLPDCLSKEPSRERIVVLENLRFHIEEEKNNPAFAKALAKKADIFVNDAFGDLRGPHASMVGIPKYLPSYPGFHINYEVSTISKLFARPKRPYLAIIGGGKTDKMPLVKLLLSKADTVVVGGVLGNILLKAQGKNAGKINIKSIQKKDFIEARNICKNPKLVLPCDAICAQESNRPDTIRIVPIEDVPPTHRILDMGPATLTHIFELISESFTILWAGTPGMYEDPHFATGTNLIAKWMARSTGVTVTAGGDTGTAVHRLDLLAKMTHVSTGGGAALALIEGKKLPGLELLKA